MDEEYKERIYKIFENNGLSKEEKDDLFYIIKKIVIHPEFIKRMNRVFITKTKKPLGEQILDDACITYLLCKGKRKVNVSVAVKIAMFHDLYPVKSKNVKKRKISKFKNKHGFRHPIEAVINAYSWYPELFPNNLETKMIIDGIIHHMFPLPVTKVRNFKINANELNNFEDTKNLPRYIIDDIVESTNRGALINFSLSRSKYKEGRIQYEAERIMDRKNRRIKYSKR